MTLSKLIHSGVISMDGKLKDFSHLSDYQAQPIIRELIIIINSPEFKSDPKFYVGQRKISKGINNDIVYFILEKYLTKLSSSE